MQEQKFSRARRDVLIGGAGALVAASVPGLARAGEAAAAPKPLPAYVAWKDPASLIMHSTSTLETRRAAFGTSVITPSEQLYIRNNLPAPLMPPSSTIAITGSLVSKACAIRATSRCVNSAHWVSKP